MRPGFLLPPLAAVCAAAVLGLHVVAVPVATLTLRPPATGLTPADYGLPYRERDMRGAGGVRLATWQVPARGGSSHGMVVLLAENGGRRSSPRMLWLADVVTNARMDVLLVDLRGHGDSAGLNTYGLGETRDLLAVLEELSREDPGRRLGAVGFSLGAACILRTLSMTDVLRFAVVFAPYSRLDADLVRHEIAYQTQGRGPARLLSPGLLLAAMRLAAGFPALPEPDELSTGRPVLLFHCTGDPEIPFRHALAIAERSRAPRLEIRALERAQHIPPIEDVLVWGDFAAELVALAGASLAK